MRFSAKPANSANAMPAKPQRAVNHLATRTLRTSSAAASGCKYRQKSIVVVVLSALSSAAREFSAAANITAISRPIRPCGRRSRSPSSWHADRLPGALPCLGTNGSGLPVSLEHGRTGDRLHGGILGRSGLDPDADCLLTVSHRDDISLFKGAECIACRALRVTLPFGLIEEQRRTFKLVENK